MKILFWLSVLISGSITIVGFFLTNKYTAIFDPNGDNFVGGNGNAGLMFIVFPSLFNLYFFFVRMFVFEKLHENFHVKRKPFQMVYVSVFVLLLFFAAYRIIMFHHYINPYFEHEVGYLNPFSNDLFFNVWTFIACLSFTGFCSFYLKR